MFLFVLAIAYATFFHGLTFQKPANLVSEYLAEDSGKLVQFAVLMIAFSLDPLRRFLEREAERCQSRRRIP